MTAIAATRDIEVRPGLITDAPVLAGQKIWKGSPVIADAASGYAQTNDGVTITLATGDVFLGFADETIDNTNGADGDLRIRIRKEGVVTLTNIAGTVNQSKVGDPVYINNTTDNAGYTLTAAGDGSDLTVGYLVDPISTTSGLVAIRPNTKTGYAADPAAAGFMGTSAVLVGKMTYDFAVDGGAVGTITPAVTCVIPSGAIVLQAIVDVITAVTTGSTTTVAVQLQSANDIVNAATVAGAPWSTTGLKAGIPVHTAATAIKLTADRTAKVVIGTADATAGKFTVYFLYVV